MREPCSLTRSGQHSSSVAIDLDGAVVGRLPQRLLVLGKFERRVGVVHLPARLLVVLGVVHQVLVQRLAVDRKAARARCGDRRDAGGGRDMHHVERRALDVLGQADHPVERQFLRQRVVHLGHVLEADAVLAHQLLVHVHDDVVVLGVDRRDAAGLGDDLQHLPDVAVLHHAAGVARPDVGGEDLDGGMAGLHRLGKCVEVRPTGSCPAASGGSRSRNSRRRPVRVRSARSTAGASGRACTARNRSASWCRRTARRG